MSLWWINYLDDAQEVQGVVIINAPGHLLAVITAHHLGLSMDYRMEIYGPFRPDGVPPEMIERLLTVEEAQGLAMYEATVNETIFDLYRDVPSEPEAETDPHSSPSPAAQAATEDA